MNRPIAVLGMFRSGTSSVAGALIQLGIQFGAREDFFEADELNQGGYFELKDVMAVNRQALATLQMSYHRLGPIPEDWLSLPGISRALGAIDAVLDKHFAGCAHWGWKDPMTSPLWPLYRKVLEGRGMSAHCLICVRNPLEVVASERKRDPLMGDRAFGLWLHYTLAALFYTIGEDRSLLVYETFLADPRPHLEPAVEASGVRPNEDLWIEACGSIVSSQRHFVQGLDELDAWPDIIGRTYLLCLEMDASPAAFRAGAFDARISSLWGEYLRLHRVMTDSGLETARLRLAWERDGRREGISAAFAPNGTWQTIRATVSANPGSPVRADLYQMPSRIWIRRSVWKTGDAAFEAELLQGETGWLEQMDGMHCVTIFGPAPLAIRFPSIGDTYELELEILVESNFDTVARMLVRFRQQIEAMSRRTSTFGGPPRRF